MLISLKSPPWWRRGRRVNHFTGPYVSGFNVISLMRIASVGCALVTAIALAADPELPASLMRELTSLRTALDQAPANMAKQNADQIALAVREFEQRVTDFLIDAELTQEDPLARELVAQLEKIRQRAKEIEHARAAPAQPAPAAAPVPTKEELDAMVKVPIDMSRVSFKKDVAPIIANVCLGCHNAQRKSGDFDASTFQSFSKQLTPGKPEESHLLDLVTGKAEPRMPRGGNTRFRKEWADIWTAWIRQGAKFDGPDRAAPITSYLIDLEDQRRQQFAKIPLDRLQALHRGHAQRLWSLVAPKTATLTRESPNLILFTTLPPAEAEYIEVLAEAALEELVDRFHPKSDSWPGKLGLFAFADRYDYIAFSRLVDGHEPENDEFGHFRLNPEFQYVALDLSSAQRDSLVVENVAEAFLRRLGSGKMPGWAAYGAARLVAHQLDPKGSGLKAELGEAGALARNGLKLADLFSGQIPWSELGPLAVSFLAFLDQTDRRQAIDFLNELSQKGDIKQALAKALRHAPDAIERNWLTWLDGAQPKRRNPRPNPRLRPLTR